jgi:hypothetical protein
MAEVGARIVALTDNQAVTHTALQALIAQIGALSAARSATGMSSHSDFAPCF